MTDQLPDNPDLQPRQEAEAPAAAAIPSEAAAPGAGGVAPELEQPVTRGEFDEGVRPLYRMHGETQGQISHTFREAEKAFGWLLLSLAFWLILVGRYALKGQLRDV